MTHTAVFGDARAEPGEKAWGLLHASEGGKSVRVAVAVIHGAKPGPHFVAMAGIHGAELNGVAAIYDFYDKIDPAQVSGTIFLIPCANPRATMMCDYVWPEGQHDELIEKYGDSPYPQTVTDEDKKNLNMQRIWPGRKGGLLVERVTHEIWTQAIDSPDRRADLLLDMHCYHAETPGTMVLPDKEMLRFGVAAGLPNIINMRYKPQTDLCTAVARRAGLNALIVENTGQNCVTPEGAAEGELVLFNLARYMGMLPGELELPDKEIVLDQYRDDEGLQDKKATTSIALECAEDTGLFIPYRQPFEIVKEGEPLGRMVDLYTGQVTQTKLRCSCMLTPYWLPEALGLCQRASISVLLASDCPCPSCLGDLHPEWLAQCSASGERGLQRECNHL